MKEPQDNGSGQMRAFHVVTAMTLLAFAGMFVWMNSDRSAPLLCLVFLLGSLGALLSEHLQLRKAIKNSASLSNVSKRIVLFSPVTGGILALAFIAIVASGLLRGELFPAFDNLDQSFTSSVDLFRGFRPSTNTDFFKLAFWSIAAGFSERIVTKQFQKAPEGS